MLRRDQKVIAIYFYKNNIGKPFITKVLACLIQKELEYNVQKSEAYAL
jgi:hypothetical protein